jgi:hypothetical protein
MSSLIKLYGEFWNPDIIEWGEQGAGKKGRLLGSIKIDGNKRDVDFWEALGVYVLYDNFHVTYVGKAFSTSIGRRVRDHLTDRLAGRWDMFSWYSTSNYRKTTNDLSKAGQRILNPETIVTTLESLAILIIDPPLNRRHESLPNALEAQQSKSPHPSTIRHYLQEILKRLEP